MANTKSAQKQARQNVVRRQRNLGRKTAIKTAIRKVLEAIQKGGDPVNAQTLLRDAEAKIARAGGKGVLHVRTASRKISRLAKRVAAHKKAA